MLDIYNISNILQIKYIPQIKYICPESPGKILYPSKIKNKQTASLNFIIMVLGGHQCVWKYWQRSL